MPTLRAWQHIYGNVERDRSPTRASGFQTLFYSHDGLSKEDVAEIEERVFYVFGNPNPSKHVFFRLNSNKVGIGKVRPVGGRDAAGREGLYFSHVLVFETGDFQYAGVNPAYFFEQEPFISTLDKAFSRGDGATGNINPVEINLPPAPSPRISWSKDAFQQLVQLAINHELLEKDRSALAFVGNPEAILTTLAQVLHFIPPQCIPQCTFDTFFERGGKLSFTYYWSVGFNESPREPIFVIADINNQVIDAGKHSGAVSAFGKWVYDGIASDELTRLFNDKERAFEVGRYLDRLEGDPEVLQSYPEPLLSSVFSSNEQTLVKRIHQQIAEKLPAPLAKKVFEPVFASLSTHVYIEKIAHGFDIEFLLNQLFDAYKKVGFVSPAKEERQALAELLETHKHKALRWLILIWGGASWENPVKKWRVKAGVEEMDAQDYQDFWAIAVPARLVDPMDLLVGGKEDLFTWLIAKNGLLKDDDVSGLIKTLLKEDKLDVLEFLAPYLSKLEQKQVKKIKKWIKGVEGIPASFEETVNLLMS